MTEREITQENVEHLRAWLARQHAPGADASDEVLREALEGAVKWIGGTRRSFTIVASNYLRDGTFHG